MIRPALPTDALAISQLSGQLGSSVPTRGTEERLGNILVQPNHCVLVAVEKEKVLGWLHAFCLPRLTSEPFAEIAAMVVDEKKRNKGIGKKLCQAAFVWAKEKGINSIRVRCNITRNDTHQFYQSLGFVEKKEQKILDLKLD